MVICFDCDAKTKAVLDMLLAGDQFRDYSEIITTAIANLAVLRTRVPNAGSAVIGVMEASGGVDSGANGTRSEPLLISGRHSQPDQQAFPDVFRLDHIPSDPPALAKITTESWERESTIPLSKWIFGQYNKLLPAKVTCRALTSLIADKAHGVPLAKVATMIAEEAAVLGDLLAIHDRKHGLRREEALQTGFPRTTMSGGVRVTNSGQLRFANQFVAGGAGKNEVSSLPIALKLVRCEGPKRLIQLTEPGWQFALLKNPVLEDLERLPFQKFSRQEIDFFLEHIGRNVPVELFSYRTLLRAISEGGNTPEKLNTSLQEMDIWWQDRKQTDSTSFLESQRSGAISRMVDLELLQRERQGTRVTYRLTPSGQGFLKQAKSVKR